MVNFFIQSSTQFKVRFMRLMAFVCLGTYGTFSLLIYGLNVYALSRHFNSYHSTFIHLYFFSAFCSSLYFLMHFVFKRFIRLGYFCEYFYITFSPPNWYISPYRIISSYCAIILFLINFLISLHRVTVILYPLQSQKMWERRHGIIFGVALLLPFTCMWFVLPSRGYVILVSTGGLSYEYERINTFMGTLSVSFFAAIAGLLFGSLTLFNIVLIIYFVEIKRLKTERSLLIFEVLMAIFTLIYATIQAAFYFTSHLFPDPEKKALIESFRNYLIDLFILPQAWILFFCNKSVRREILKKFLQKERSQLASLPAFEH